MLEKPPTDLDTNEFILSVAGRLGFFFYWIFDNAQILAKLRLLKRPAKDFVKPSMFFWWLAIVFTLALNISKLVKLRRLQRNIRIALSKEPEQKPDFEPKIRSIITQKNAALRNIIKCLGDLFPSSAGWGLTDALGLKVTDSHIGLGGLVSALIVCWEVFPGRK